jgi:hypothetical protein
MAGLGIIEANQLSVSAVDGKDADRGRFNGQALKQVQWKAEVVSEGKLDGVRVRDTDDPAFRMFMFSTQAFEFGDYPNLSLIERLSLWEPGQRRAV